ncbi:hypothetical protein GCM10025760_26210 [Microbacterium yannicii]|uniref:Uncharacterized protein n=1 Tax=Microbacterium yannicii TaxID=671622 RepID=A0ABP9MDW1_9MICO
MAFPGVELAAHEPGGAAGGRALFAAGQQFGGAAKIVEGGHAPTLDIASDTDREQHSHRPAGSSAGAAASLSAEVGAN